MKKSVTVPRLVLCAIMVAGIARADVTAAWNKDAGGNWSDVNNWAGGSAATGTTGVAYFTNAITATRYVTNDVSPWTINSLVVSNNGANYLRIATNGTINLGGTTPTIAVNGSASKVSVGAALTGSSGLVKTGAGELDIDQSLPTGGAGANTYSGGTYVMGGMLMFGTYNNNNMTGLIGSGPVYLGDSSGAMDALLLSQYGSYTLTNNIIVQSGGTGKAQLKNNGGYLSVYGAIILGSQNGNGRGIVFGSLGGGLQLYGPVSDPVGLQPGTAGTVSIANQGNVHFNGTNTYSGATVIDAGGQLVAETSTAGSNAGLPPATALTVNGSFSMNTRSFMIGSLSGTGRVDDLSGYVGLSQTLTIGSNNNSTTFSGIISNNNSCIISLTKIGTGTQTLSSANCYRGLTTISNGTLAVSNNLALSTNAVILAGGTLGAAIGTWAITNVVNVQAASSLGATGTLALMGNVTNNGALTVVSGGILVNGSKTGTGALTVSGGYLGGTGTVYGVVTNAGTITAADTNSVGTLTLTNLVVASGSTVLWNFNDTTNDVIVVNGNLAVPAVATVNVSRVVAGSGLARVPSVIFSGFSNTIASSNVAGWVVTGNCRPDTKVVVANGQVQLVAPTGMLLEIY